jgi:hypothetical protein
MYHAYDSTNMNACRHWCSADLLLLCFAALLTSQGPGPSSCSSKGRPSQDSSTSTSSSARTDAACGDGCSVVSSCSSSSAAAVYFALQRKHRMQTGLCYDILSIVQRQLMTIQAMAAACSVSHDERVSSCHVAGVAGSPFLTVLVFASAFEQLS